MLLTQPTDWQLSALLVYNTIVTLAVCRSRGTMPAFNMNKYIALACVAAAGLDLAKGVPPSLACSMIHAIRNQNCIVICVPGCSGVVCQAAALAVLPTSIPGPLPWSHAVTCALCFTAALHCTDTVSS